MLQIFWRLVRGDWPRHHQMENRSSGSLGGRIARGLLDRGERVRVLVRPESAYAGLRERGAEVVFGDLKEAERRGYYGYAWSVPPGEGHEGFTVWARGSDPEFLSSLSLSGYVPPRAPPDPASAPVPAPTD